MLSLPISNISNAGRRGGSGGGGYHASAVHFDGSTWLRNGSLTATNSNFLSFSFWWQNTDLSSGFSLGDGTPFVIDSENNYTTYIATEHGGFDANLGSVGGNLYVSTAAAPNSNLDLKWHNFLYSGQTGQASPGNTCAAFIDDIDVTSSLGDQGPFQMVFNGLSFFFGSDSFGASILGNIADVWVAPNVSLLTGGTIAQADRRKFISALGKPVNPSGFPASAILFSGNHTTFPTNQGPGGAFVLTGALTDAASSPSD